MSRRNNKTDQQFRDRLKHYEAAPPEPVWEGITTALQTDKRKKRVLWVRRMAASVALLLALGTTWFWLREPLDDQLVTTDNQETVSREEAVPSQVEVPVIPTDPETPAGKRGSIIQNQGEIFAKADLPSTRDPVELGADEQGVAVPFHQPHPDPLGHMRAIPATGLQTNFPDPGTLLAVAQYTPDQLDEAGGIDVFDEFGEDGKPSYDKWGVGTQVSPIYSYRNLEVSGGDASNALYYDDVENGIVSYAGGINVQYAPLKRLSVQSGLYYSNMGMKVENAYYASLGNRFSIMDESTAIQASINNSTGIIETREGLDYAYAANSVPKAGWELASQGAMARSHDEPTGEILQQFQYLELPLILRYRVIDRRLGFHFLGGLSSNFLVGNSAYYQEGGEREQIGTTANLRPVNYSSVVGLGLDYSISKRFHVNVEPTFRYYLNSINTGSIIKSHPYSIGFFTGLLYTF